MGDLSKGREQYRKQTRNTLIAVVVITMLLFFAYGIWFGLIHRVPPAKDDPAIWGSFGDFIGGILNPIVAFCALYWLTRSIEIQREELSDTKKELADTRKLIAEQAETAEKQRFEDTFFALLNQHNQALRHLAKKKVHKASPTSSAEIHRFVFSRDTNSILKANEALHSLNQEVGSYFRILYQLLKLIATRCPSTTMKGDFNAENIITSSPSADEKLYSNIVRSFLDAEMTQLLAINCFCEKNSSAYWNYKCLIERYSFFEHMPFSMDGRAFFLQVISHYERSAFGNSDFLLDQQKNNPAMLKHFGIPLD